MDGVRWRWLEAGHERDRRDWAEVLGRCRHDFHHWPEYADLEAQRLDGEGGALLVEAHGDAALLPLVLRPLPAELGVEGVDACSPYGYTAPVFTSSAPEFTDAAITAFVEGLRERGAVTAFVRLHPLLEVPETLAAHGQLVEHGPTVWIDLEADEQTQWSEYRPRDRSLLNKAEREGLMQVRFDDEFEHFDAFFAIYAATMGRHHSEIIDRDYLRDFATMLGHRGFLALVEHEPEGKFISAGMFIRCNGIVQYHLAGTAEGWHHLGPSRLMIDRARRRCSELGDRQLHLGGGVQSREDELYRFKRGFSRRRGRFRSWRVVVDPVAHATLLSRWESLGGDPEKVGEWFPRYRAPTPLARSPEDET